MIITFANRKGGVGKTVSCFNFGARLHQLGYKVLYVDLDSQGNLTYDFGLPAESYCGSMDAIKAGSAAWCILQTDQGDLMPSTDDLAGADMVITGNGKENRLKTALMPLTRKYDYILIDTGPQLNILTTNALIASDTAVICAQAEVHSLQGIAQLYDTIKTVRTHGNSALTVNGILLTRFNSRSVLARAMKKNLQDTAVQIGTSVYNAVIRECTAIREAEAMQTDIFSYSKRSNGAADYAAFTDEFLQKEGRA